MRPSIGVPVLLLVLLAVFTAAPAAAFNWGVGADLGFNRWLESTDYPNAENVSSFVWPAGPGVENIEDERPALWGLRVSFAGEKPTHEVYVGTALDLIWMPGTSGHVVGVGANYQYNFDLKRAFNPYVTAGAGLNMFGVSHSDDRPDWSATAPNFGGGVGLAHWMGNGCGRLRAEVRYDQQTEAKEGDEVRIRKGGNIAVKLGFDLWDKKK
jgi:hypothetical protein